MNRTRRGKGRSTAALRKLIAALGPEAQECYTFCEGVQRQYPALWPLLVHIPNERQSQLDRAILALLGVKSGVSDYLLPVARGGYPGMWMEFKRTGATWSKVTPSQRWWLDAMRAEGWFCAVAYGVDQALAIMAAYVREQPLEQFWYGPRGR